MSIRSPYATKRERGAYSAIVYLEGNLCVAEDELGTILKEDANATTVIQAAIDTLPSSGGNVVVMDGNYEVTGIKVPDNTTLQGFGFNTKITLASGSTGPVITNDDHSGGNTGIVIRDLFVDGNDAGAITYSRGIELSKTAKSTILNCWAQNCKEGGLVTTRGIGIYVVDGSTDITIKNCFATDNGHEGIGVRQSCERISVIGCLSWDNDVEGIQVAINAAPGPCKDILIMGNICNGHASYVGIIAHGNGLERISIINNIVNGAGGGIWMLADASYNINNIISGNMIYNTKAYANGITLTRTQSTIVDGNQIIDGDLQGIRIDNADCCTIANNKVINSTGYGISVVNSDYCALSSNTVKDSLAGFYTSGDYGIIDGNHFYYNAEHGVLISGGYNTIINNYIIDNNTDDDNIHVGVLLTKDYNAVKNNKIYLTNSAVGHYNGIHLTVDADYSVIEGNDLRDSGKNALLYDAGSAGTIIRANTGYITENDGTSTGTSAQQTVAHGLSAAPTIVMVGDIEQSAAPYQSAAADGTNIYVTAGNGLDWWWKAEV